ncbi:2-keto-4-pentenoate hydratase [Sphingomonas sp.]|uniref:2-keto-4-pentenoate hydratase n=1 Tax=Sphingomonas sp. TaxID=28214 RepID=UPI003CC5A0FA
MGADVAGDVETIARAFVTARRAGRALSGYPGVKPGLLADGYAVQDVAIALSGGTVAGWKVGKIDPPIDGVDRLAGPIFADRIVHADPPPAMAIFAGGFAAAEAEFLLRLGRQPDPARTAYTLAEARALIDAVHIGIEIASSPFDGINRHGPAVTVSDFGNNNGLVVGAELPGWRDADVNAIAVELLVNGERVGAGTAAMMLDGPFGAARFLLEHMAARGIELPAGTWISSGAVTGVHAVAAGDAVEARFDGKYSARCTIKPH